MSDNDLSGLAIAGIVFGAVGLTFGATTWWCEKRHRKEAAETEMVIQQLQQSNARCAQSIAELQQQIDAYSTTVDGLSKELATMNMRAIPGGLKGKPGDAPNVHVLKAVTQKTEDL